MNRLRLTLPLLSGVNFVRLKTFGLNKDFTAIRPLICPRSAGAANGFVRKALAYALRRLACSRLLHCTAAMSAGLYIDGQGPLLLSLCMPPRGNMLAAALDHSRIMLDLLPAMHLAMAITILAGLMNALRSEAIWQAVTDWTLQATFMTVAMVWTMVILPQSMMGDTILLWLFMTISMAAGYLLAQFVTLVMRPGRLKL